MRCGRMNALYPTGKVSELGNPDRELRDRTVAPAEVWSPKAKPCKRTQNTRRKIFFSSRVRIPKPHTRHDTSHQILSRRHRRAKTRDAIACSLITVSLSRLTLLNFPSHTVPYTHGHDRVSKVNDSGRACRRRRCSLLCFPLAHRFVIGSSIGSLLCFPLAKAE